MNNEWENKLELTVIAGLALLLILNTMYRMQSEMLTTFGNVSINVSLIASLFLFLFSLYRFKWRRSKQVNTIRIVAVLFLLTYFISYLSSSYSTLWEFFQLAFLFMFIIWSSSMKWKPSHIKIIAYLLCVVTILIFVQWMQFDHSNQPFRSVYRNQNYLAIFLFTTVYFKFTVLKYCGNMLKVVIFIVFLMDLMLIYATGSRAVMIGLCITIGVWIVMKQAKRFYKYLLGMTIIANMTFIVIYIILQHTKIGIMLNDLSLQLFGKNLYSGRGELWAKVIHKAVEHPIMGSGTGISARNVTDMNLTAHNQYIQLFLEIGIIGLIMFIVFVFTIWRALIANSRQFAANWSICFLIGFLIYENFELTMFQNNYSIAMLQWVIITIGVNFDDTGTLTVSK
ncbi:O-antigen ligase family protein [Virgibacillus oceani]|uniref:O-antigen ligase-related domain-containing protein n=1 Tax=Virgibacillus oceani TaxID=1479511 RepID=A0A917HAY8_9BACI|nr:O-antigen ligase family protein [Virgibacillus oceani]GGG73444.1 hypothetical protein GCM10011398_17380 [Virgibacillus oceani]